MPGFSRNTFKRRLAGLAALLLTILLFTGLASSMIWPQFQQNANRTGFLDVGAVVDDPRVRFQFETNNDVSQVSPAISDGSVFFGSSNGVFYSADTSTGDENWQADIGEPPSGSVVTENRVFVTAANSGSPPGGFYVIDKSSGDILNSFNESYAFSDPPVRYGDALFYGDSDGNFYKYNLSTDSISNIYSLGEYDGAAAWNDTVFISNGATGEDGIHAIDLDGNKKWSKSSSPVSTPTVADGKLFFSRFNSGSFEYIIEAFEVGAGDSLWNSTVSSSVIGNPSVKGGNLFVPDAGGVLHKIDTETGTEENTVQTALSSPPTGTAIANETIYFGGQNGRLVAHNTSDLSEVWQFQPADGVMSSPAIESGSIYFGGASSISLFAISEPTPDEEPPKIHERALRDGSDGNEVLKNGDTVTVWANVTDNREISSVEANLTEFGAGDVPMQSETNAGYDWNQNGVQESGVYGANASVDEASSTDGTSKSATVTAVDGSSNTNTSEKFGSLTVDTEAPIFDSINISLIGTANPIFEANISEDLSGLDQSDTELKLNDSSGDVFSGTVAGLTGVSAPEDENITFDMTQRPESFVDGGVTVNITPEDVAGNTGDTVLKDFVVDTTPPQDMSIDSPVSKNFLKSSENFTVEYSYTEPHPESTTVSIVDQQGNEEASISVDESGEDADGSVEFNLDNDSYSITSGEIYDVELYAVDQVDNSDTITEEELLAVDDTPPELNNSEKLSDTEFNFSVSDNLGLDASSIEASDFEFRTGGVSGSFSVGPCGDEDTVCDVKATLDSEVDIYSVTVGLKSGDDVSDLAGNIQSSDTVTVEKMDGIPPEIEAFNLEDLDDGNGFVSGGDTVRVYANVTDGVKVSSVTANMTEFGMGDQALESEASSQDWNDDGGQDQKVYGADIVLPESVEDMDNASSWITAEDNSSNSNTTPEFEELEIDNTPPEIEIDNPLQQNPRYIQPAEDLEVNFTYTEKNPEALNISVGPEHQIFESFGSGTDIDANRTVEASELPVEGEYSLNLTMNDSAGLEGSDNQSSSVFIDGTDSENVSDLKHYDETAKSGYDDDTETNFTWTAATDEISGVDYYNIYISTDGGSSFSEASRTEDTNYTVATADGDEAQIKVQPVDRAGNAGFNKSSPVIEVDTVPPEASIYDPLAEDNIVNSSEQNSFKVNGTIENDLEGEVVINVSDLGDNISDTFSFSGGEFSGNLDISGLNDGSVSVKVSPTDQAGNTGDLASTQVTKDTVPPILDEAYKINSTAFNATFSDSLTGLDKNSIVRGELGLDYGSIEKVDTDNIVSGDKEENATVLLGEKIDSETLNFSVTGEIFDVAGNVLDSGWTTLNNMDHVPPNITDKNLSDMNGDGVVEETDKIQVFVNVTDGTGVESVEANLSGFGDSLESVTMESEQASSYDWNGDGELSSDIYGTNATVESSAESGVQSAKVTVTDTSSNSNINTSESFGGLEVVKEAPEIDIENPLESSPAYFKPSEDLEVTFNYTEDDSDELNISVGSNYQIFAGLEAGEDLEKTEVFSSENLPSNGTYDLELNLTNTVGLQGNDSEASAVVVDEYAPSDLSVDVPSNKKYLTSSENFSVNYSYTEVNPDWTEVRLVNESGDVGLKKNVSEASEDPEGQVKFENLENLDESVNYTVEVEAGDKSGWTTVASEENLLVVDDTAPVLQNPRKLSDSQYRFDIYDEGSGIVATGLDYNDFEIKEDLEAVFAVTCSTGRLNCTVDVDIREETNNVELTAGLGAADISSVSDQAGNQRTNDEVILEDADTMAPGLESMNLNVSTPVNNSFAPGTINVTLGFNESMDTSQNPVVDINNLATSYTVSGDYINSTHWTGTFEINDDDENTEAYVNISQASDEAGNLIDSRKDSDKFAVDTEEPEITVENNFGDENLSDTVDLSQYFSESTDNGYIDSYEFNDGSGWAEIDSQTSWDSKQASSGEVDFRVNATDDAGNRDSVTATSTVDNSPPVIQEAYIRIEDDSAEEGVLNDGDNFSIEVEASDVDTAVESVEADVSEVTSLEDFVELEKDQSGNFTGIFTVNKSANIESYSPEVNVSDIEGNFVEASTDNSVSVDSVPVEIDPEAIYTFLEQDKYDNNVANPGDEINVSWNSTENGIDDIKNVTVDFGDFGGVREASDLSGDGVYSAVIEISEGDRHDALYSGEVTVNTLSGESDTDIDDESTVINNDVPDAPTSLEASAVSDGAIDLTWNGVSPGDLDGYRVYRNSSEGFQEIDTTDNPGYTDTTAVEGNTYAYKVSAFDTALNEGPNSSEASAISDATAPEITSAETYNRTAINVTFEDDYHEVDADSIDFSAGEAVGFDEDGEKVSGLVIKDRFSTGATPEVNPNVQDTVGNQDFYTTVIEASDGVSPEVKSMSMDDVTSSDSTATVEVTYTEGMDTSVPPDFGVSYSYTSEEAGEWINSTTFVKDNTFDVEEDNETALISVNNAFDDSDNVQETSGEASFDIDTVAPQPVIEGLSEGDTVKDKVFLNSSGAEMYDVETVEWIFTGQGGSNQSIATLGSLQNETEWSTPLSEFETDLWLKYIDDAGNTGVDSVGLEVDNVEPSINGDLSDFVSGEIDLTSEIEIGSDAESYSYEYDDGSGWTEINSPSSWSSTEASEGSVSFRVNATDDAENFNSEQYTTTVDNTAPDTVSVDSPSGEVFIRPEDGVTVDYSYTEENTANTTVRLLNDDGVALEKVVEESSADPDRSVELDTSTLETDNFSLEVVAEDLAGLEQSASTSKIVHVDSERPVIVNGTYYNDTRMSFQIVDNETGIDNSSVQASDFEVLTDAVEASGFEIVSCESYADRCTVNAALEEPGGYTAEFGVKNSEQLVDRAGNTVNTTVHATDPFAEGPKADFNLNVSTPLNTEDAGETVGLTVNFSKQVNNSKLAYVDLLDSTVGYGLSGTYENETHWTGEFDVVDQSQEDNITVKVSNVDDYDGNALVQNEIGTFNVDLKPPQLSLESLQENISETVNLTDKLLETSSGFESADFRYRKEAWNSIQEEDRWDTTEIEDGKITVEVQAMDNAENTETVEKEVTIDNTRPEINYSYTNATDSSDTLGLGENFSLEVNISDNFTGVEKVEANISNVSNVSGLVELNRDNETIFSGNFTVNKSVEISGYRPEIFATDYAGNNVSMLSSSIDVDSTDQQQEGAEDGENDGSQDGSGSDSGSDSGGGSSGGSSGGGGGGFLPGIGDENESDNESENGSESDGNDSSGGLDPGLDNLEINVTPELETVEVERNETVVYRPEVYTSSPVEVEVSVEGLEDIIDYSESLEIQGSRELQIEASGTRETGQYTGNLIASAGDSAGTAQVTVNIVGPEQQNIDLDVGVENNTAEYRSDTGQYIDDEASVETKIYDVEGNVVRTVENIRKINGSNFNGSISLEGLDAGDYTIEAVVTAGEDVYSGRQTFEIPASTQGNPYIALTAVMALLGGISALYLHRNSGTSKTANVSRIRTFDNSRTFRRDSQASESRKFQEDTEEIEKSAEEDPFDDINDMFEDEEVVRETEEASSLMSRGEMKRAEEKLEQAKNSDFFSGGNSFDEIKDRVKEAHRKFREGLS